MVASISTRRSLVLGGRLIALGVLVGLLATVPAAEPIPSAPADLAAAVAAWCQEDAANATAAGQTEVAAADQADAARKPAPARPARDAQRHDDLLPPLAAGAVQDPLVTEFLKKLDKLVKENRQFPHGPAGAEIRGPEGWVFPTRADELLDLVQVFCHPQSPRRDDARLVTPILRRLAIFAEHFVPNAKILGDFGCADNAAEAWLILKTVRPDIVPAGLAARVEAGLQVNAEFIAKKWGATFLDPSVHYGVVNMDVRRILALALTDRALGRQDYTEMVRAGVHFVSHSVLPDGGTHYAERQNEAFGYHIAAVRSLIRLWQVSNLPEAKELVTRLRWYYPLSVEPGGVAEWASASSWHHYWNTHNGADGALLVAAITNCPHNQRIARSGTIAGGDLWMASFLRPDLAPAPAPDHYFVHDRNIEGPRGRFGTWSFLGSARNFHYEDADKARGRTSYVGAMLTTGATGNWPLDAALQDAGVGVRVKPGELPGAEMTWIREVAALSAAETTTSATSARCAALGATSRLTTYAQVAGPFRQRQAWIFTPQRMVGLLTITADADATARGLLGTLVLISGRGHWGTRKELVQTGPGAYTFGGLAITLHAHDFTGVTSLITEAMSGSATHSQGSLEEGKSVRLVLQDEHATSDEAAAYTAGTRRYYLVEIRPAATAPARTVSQHQDGTLLTTEVVDATGTYRLAYNAGTDAVAWTPSAAPGAVVHRSGETFRPAWIGTDGKAESSQPGAPLADGPLNLPAGELALVEVPAKP